MININHNGSTVKVAIEGQFPIKGYTVSFNFNCPDAFYAILVEHNFSEALNDRIERIRKEEYESGWKDAKSKKPKRNWFSRTMNLGVVE